MAVFPAPDHVPAASDSAGAKDTVAIGPLIDPTKEDDKDKTAAGTTTWCEMGDKKAAEKTSQALREKGGVAASEKENDVVSAAISLVIPPRPSSCNFQVGGTGKIYFEWQAHHFPAASLVPPKKKRGQKRAAIDVNDEHSLSMALDATRKL